ncbi:AAA family ATPase [Porticoccaceae bacterium]|nr:AAA family ATPase [Porticoccaceae bacterium]
MNFRIIPRGGSAPGTGINTVYLKIDFWNDYSFVTMFYLSVHDENGAYHEIENVKIGFQGQTTAISTHSTFQSTFQQLPESYFSLGNLDYYQGLTQKLSDETKQAILVGLRDVVFAPEIFEIARDEEVFGTSLMRSTSLSAIKGQFKRVLEGRPPLTDFKFIYKRPQEELFAGINLEFDVKAGSKPSTNIHALIGRNGIGKTKLLNGMTEAITDMENSPGKFHENNIFGETLIGADFFSRLVSVSFSAFDPFTPPPEQTNPALGTCYYYVGLNKLDEEEVDSQIPRQVQIREKLNKEFCSTLMLCLSDNGRKRRWLRAVELLGSDENFRAMQLPELASCTRDEFPDTSYRKIKLMSSGHAVVLLIITNLVALVEEKTLVLLDEPEGHLHPPLLSAFIRALSELLSDRNGVAIIATHSPVVLQEVPMSCVWKVTRSRLAMTKCRPNIQTFGENVGTLTREVFGLEVSKSGFHSLLEESVTKGGTFDEISAEYNYQLGYEAQAILRAMIHDRNQDEARH